MIRPSLVLSTALLALTLPAFSTTLTSISPSSATAGSGAINLQLNGDFNDDGTTVYWFSNLTDSSSTLTITNLTPTSITATIPASLLTTPDTVFVYVVEGSNVSAQMTFTVTKPAPTITALLPNSAIAGSGPINLTVFGSNIPALTAQIPTTVLWNGQSIPTTYVSATQLNAVVPASLLTSPGTAQVTISTQPQPSPLPFTITSPLTLTAITPNSAQAGSSQLQIQLNGAGFTPNTTVTWNGSTLSSIYSNSNLLLATVPANLLLSPGVAQVGVAVSGQTSPPTLPFTIISTLTLSSISPTSATAGGSAFTMTLNGSGFNNQSVAFFNSSSLTTTFLSANQLTASVPAGLIAQAGSDSVSVHNGSASSNALSFTVNPVSVTLTALNPNSAVAGSGAFTLTASGTGFSSGNQITFNSTTLSTTFVNANTLTATVPAALIGSPGTASVTITNSSLPVSNSLPFTITQPAPTLISISPNTAVAGSGAFTLTANGTNFISGATITWNGSPLNTAFISANQLSANVPANLIANAGTAAVGVNLSGQSTSTLPFTITSALTLTSISPTTAVAGSAAFTLTANGSGFGSLSFITWNGSSLSTTFVSANQLSATVPATLVANPGTAAVGVNSSGQSTPTLPFTITAPAPTLTSISPNTTIAGSPAFSLIATGSGFTSGSIVIWNGSPLSTTFNSANQLTATVPSNLVASVGTASVGVSVPGQTSPVALPFTITSGLTLTSISPASAAVNSGGFTLNATGTGFTSSTVLTWNGSPLATSFGSSTSLSASIPASFLTSSGQFGVTAVNGSQSSNTLNFSVTPPPIRLISVAPNTAPAGSPALTINVTGSGFSGTSVTWNGVTLTTQFVSATQLTATVPPNLLTQPGTAAVSVTGNPTPSSLPFIITGSLTLTSVTPSNVTAGGPAFTLTAAGTGFGSGTLLTWNGVALTTTFISSTQLTATVPASLITAIGTAQVGVVAQGLPSPPTLPVTITQSITLTSLSPANAIAGGPGFTLTATGTGFLSGTTLNWNGTALPTTVISATQLSAAVAASFIAQPGSASITASNGTIVSNALTFAVVPPTPTITTLSPSSAIAGGQALTLTITGTGYLPTSSVTWNGTGLSATFVSATQLTAAVTADLIAKVGTASVVVSNGNLSSNAAIFTIRNPAPTITSISPSSVVAGGPAFTLNVTGTGFLSGATVSVNSVNVATTFGSATSLTASVGADVIAKAGTVQVSVSNSDGQSSNSVPLTITSPTLSITSISPSTVAANGPAFTLNVTGTGFLSGATVSFNSTALSTTFVSATQLTAAVPANLILQTGSASITAANPNGATSNAVTLTIATPGPTLTSISPATVTQGGPAFTLTLNGANFASGSTASVGGTSVPTTFVSATQLTAAVPATAIQQPGNIPVTVTNPGSAPSNPLPLAVTPAPPTITSIDPVSARVGDATFTLSVTGTGFVQASIVQWDGAPLATTFVSPTQLTATIAAGRLILPATASVTVANPGPLTSLVSNAVTFTINPVIPTLTSLSPNSANAGDAAFTLTVNGTGLLNLTVIQWNSTQLTTHFVSATQVTADVPASLLVSAGNASVTALNPGNNVSNALTFSVNTVGPAVLSTLSKTSATAGDAAFTLTITGTGFRTGATINFGTTALTTTVVSATQLTATVPANLLATPATFQVTVQQGGTTSNALSFVVNLPPPPALRIVPPPIITPGGQTTLDFGLNTPYPITLTGTVTLTFTSNATVPVDDPMIQFATGGRTFTFTVPPNTTSLPALQVQTGTVAGTITVAVTLSALGVNVTPSGSTATIVVAKSAPVMVSGKVKLVHASGYIEVDITGFSTTRDMTSATFHLNATPGATFISQDFTVNVSSLFTTWFQSSTSTQFGGQFSYAQPFNLIGDTNQVQSVTVTLTNSAGASVTMTTQ